MPNAAPMGMRAARCDSPSGGAEPMTTIALPAPRLLLTPKEAATVLAVGERTLWALTAPRGPIRPVRVGRSVRYTTDALQSWIEAHQIQEANHAS